MVNRVSDHLSLLSKMGRGGDTKLRNVDGELSHVNADEAAAIDMYGSVGENVVKAVGSGTINPDTGLREYQGGFAGATVLSGGTSVVGGGSAAVGSGIGSSILAGLGTLASYAVPTTAILTGLSAIAGIYSGAKQRGVEMDVAEETADLYTDMIESSKEKVLTLPGMQQAETNIATMMAGTQYEGIGSKADISVGNINESLDALTKRTKGIEQVGKIDAISQQAEQRLFRGVSTGYEQVGAKYIADTFGIEQKYADIKAQEEAKQKELEYKRSIEQEKAKGIHMGEHRGWDFRKGKTDRWTWGDRPGFG